MGGQERRNHDNMNEEIQAAVDRGLQRYFLRVGVDVDHPLEMQEDFAHLRRHRKTIEKAGEWSRRFFLLTILGAAVAFIVMGFEAWRRHS